MAQQQSEIKVWDPFVRIGHWTLALAFVVAYFTAEEVEDVHVAAGYWIGAYIVARVIWGFVGSRYARFRDFVYRPSAVFGYLAGLVSGNAARYVGHNPAGGAMVIAILLALAGTVTTGLLLQGQSEHEGPLAAMFATPANHTPAAAAPGSRDVNAGHDEASNRNGDEAESPYEEVHEVFVNISIVLIALHLLGVLASSIVHRENLPRSMVTGRKSAPGTTERS